MLRTKNRNILIKLIKFKDLQNQGKMAAVTTVSVLTTVSAPSGIIKKDLLRKRNHAFYVS